MAGSSKSDDLIEQAKLAEIMERYDDMTAFMKELVTRKNKLTRESRNMLSVAYKKEVAARRLAWRKMQMYINSSDDTHTILLAKDYQDKIALELKELCDTMINLLDEHIVIGNSRAELEESEEDDLERLESQVFFIKMRADYHRYIAEVTTGNERQSAIAQADTSYENAYKLSKDMPTAHYVRLGLALNYSVFQFEIQREHIKACEIASKAYDEAVNNLQKEIDRDSILITELLRENLVYWTTD